MIQKRSKNKSAPAEEKRSEKRKAKNGAQNEKIKGKGVAAKKESKELKSKKITRGKIDPKTPVTLEKAKKKPLIKDETKTANRKKVPTKKKAPIRK